MLQIADLTYRLGPRLLFDEASAMLPAGARVGLVGRNGVGKTTLFRLIAGEIAPEGGSIALPRRARLGEVEQEAPGGETKLIDFVLAADLERAALLTEAESADDPARIAEIQTRLVDIDAHAAPARAAAILAGLGFDDAAQRRPLSAFSGGWRMRVALAAALFTTPDMLLLDEPTNYLDIEGTLWLMDHLAKYPASLLIISHDRDLLDHSCDHILHLDRGKLTLYRGNYSSFERQRREQQMLLGKAAKKQEAKRKHLQSFVDRFRAKATKARQAQARLKVLARMEEVELIVDDSVLPFHLPSAKKPLSPPIIAMENVSAGYGGTPVLSRVNLSLSNDDRIGLLGANGNGKSTLAKLIGGRLDPLGGKITRAPKLAAGFFTQHQVDDLDPADTPLSAVRRLVPDASETTARAHTARLGFPATKAETPVALLSGGEKARLLLGLAAFDAPHLLILDEPTNHLDIDSRTALIDALNEFEGAVILIAHDRHLLEASVDRLWLVADGGVTPFEGDLDDYRRLVLEKNGGAPREPSPVPNKRETSERKREPSSASMRKRITALEEQIGKFENLIARVDAALADPDAFSRDPHKAAQLAAQRHDLHSALAAAEEEWLRLSAELENA
ncbi:MAG: ABC-F family ATP-binding cassette domain-containing protein [Methylobacteriaceae bacterium]|nr:ABC-F family ATP-binding cassette domain-containing protein [Methylobacteriaceae bacterium]